MIEIEDKVTIEAFRAFWVIFKELYQDRNTNDNIPLLLNFLFFIVLNIVIKILTYLIFCEAIPQIL